MEETGTARVRVNYSGKRYIGEAALPSPTTRVSDVLNDGTPFLCLRNVQTTAENEMGGTIGLNKDRITYIQVIEEARNPPGKRVEGQFLHVEAALAGAEEHPIRGGIFIPEWIADVGDIINDGRAFLSLTDAEIAGTSERYPYLALSKRQVTLIQWRFFSW